MYACSEYFIVLSKNIFNQHLSILEINGWLMIRRNKLKIKMHEGKGGRKEEKIKEGEGRREERERWGESLRKGGRGREGKRREEVVYSRITVTNGASSA